MSSGIEGSLAAFRADVARCMRKIINESTTITDDVKIRMFSILFGNEKPKPSKLKWKKLKEKYKSKVLGCELDKDRIPGIDITLKEKQNFKIGNASFEVIFIPGHTKGHIAFYFKDEKIVFTGDTLFSLGCGRVFEGTYEQMFSSLNKLKNLPIDTKIYCGHEYTKKNLEFCLEYDSNNELLRKKSNWINSKIESNSPTVPISIDEEKKTNIFLRCNEPSIKNALNLNNASEQEIFSKLRDLKDSF